MFFIQGYFMLLLLYIGEFIGRKYFELLYYPVCVVSTPQQDVAGQTTRRLSGKWYHTSRVSRKPRPADGVGDLGGTADGNSRSSRLTPQLHPWIGIQ